MAASASPEPRIDIKSAVQIALEYSRALFNDNRNINFMLEEVEFDAAANTWLITVGFDIERQVRLTPLAAALAMQEGNETTTTTRAYKTVKVDAKTGNPLAVKIRKVD